MDQNNYNLQIHIGKNLKEVLPELYKKHYFVDIVRGEELISNDYVPRRVTVYVNEQDIVTSITQE